MTTYKHERYITTAIQSVLDQTFRDFELVIVNDGSTDGRPASASAARLDALLGECSILHLVRGARHDQRDRAVTRGEQPTNPRVSPADVREKIMEPDGR
jgi:GT2 family glycosyltransferase